MDGMQLFSSNNPIGAQLTKFIAILMLSAGIGFVASNYSPLIPLAFSAVFTIAVIGLYMSSQATTAISEPQTLVEAAVETSKNSIVFYLFYVGFFLSITIPKSGRTISGIPITTSNMIILLALVFWFVWFLISRKSFFVFPMSKPLISFIIYGFAAFFIGIVKNNSVRAVVLDFVAFIGFVPLYLLVCSLVRKKKHISLIVTAVVIGILIVSGYGILQKQLGVERVAVPGITEQHGKIMFEGVGRWNVIEGGGQKLYSTFQNGNVFGNHLATFIPFLGGILLGMPASRKRLVSIGIFLLSAYILFLTYSRGAMVGMASGILALALVSKKIRVKALLVLFLIIILMGGVLFRYADRPELTRYDIRRIASDPDRFSAGRLERAEQVVLGFNTLPLAEKFFGLGFGGILISPEGWRIEYVDNLYLSLLFKIGLVGMTLFFWTLFSFFGNVFQLRRKISDVYYLGLINGGIAGIFASLVHNLADTLWLFPPLSANFWMLAGITMAVAMIASRETMPEAEVVSQKLTPVVRKFNPQENRRGAQISI